MLQKTAIANPHTLRCLGKDQFFKNQEQQNVGCLYLLAKFPQFMLFFPFWNNFYCDYSFHLVPAFQGFKDPPPKLV